MSELYIKVERFFDHQMGKKRQMGIEISFFTKSSIQIVVSGHETLNVYSNDVDKPSRHIAYTMTGGDMYCDIACLDNLEGYKIIPFDGTNRHRNQIINEFTKDYILKINPNYTVEELTIQKIYS